MDFYLLFGVQNIVFKKLHSISYIITVNHIYGKIFQISSVTPLEIAHIGLYEGVEQNIKTV